ncbi:FAD/NAD(P)-dependent oxidoreductase [Frigidibacter sp. MR17.24]|uniref:FAD/NAD(P)-dependent oxidoreductase n=1 Tax=Frigidibacter sp. MR17.24 TaxID=3127345 RepID=UPI003012B922
MTQDPRSVAGKRLTLDGHAQLLVIGAGPAGRAAALEAAAQGLSVVLVDENPVAADTMAADVPLHFGSRIGAAARNRAAMTEAMLRALPELEQVIDAGVDLRIGTACWGLYLNGTNMGWMPGPVAGLATAGEGTALLGFDQAIVATGRRDMGLAFPGWDAPGVMGAAAAQRLAGLYDALDGRRAVVMGSTAEALLAAIELQGRGIAVAAVIEQAAAPVGPPDLLAALHAAGIPLICDEVVTGVETGPTGVTAARTRTGVIPCDLVIQGIGAVPMVDLLAAAGCRIAFSAARGGFVPVLGAGAATSHPAIRAAGDCAGIWPGKSRDAAVAAAEGRAAALAAATGAETGAGAGAQTGASALPDPDAPAYDIDAYRKGWVRRSVVDAALPAVVCQCEEVTAREILELRPPRYLGWQAADNRPRTLDALLGAGPPDPDQVKRLTRAGMGACQGRRCREQVQALLALQAAVPLPAVPLAGYRAPVRPLTLAEACPRDEDPAFAQHWDSWFGMPRQWVPFWDVEPDYTVAGLAQEKPHVTE